MTIPNPSLTFTYTPPAPGSCGYLVTASYSPFIIHFIIAEGYSGTITLTASSCHP
jgi:hypothetical protein